MTTPDHQIGPVVLTLPGHEPVDARADLEFRHRRTRVSEAILAIVGFLIMAVAVAIIPPHLPWALIALVAGGIVAYRNYHGCYLVQHFEGTCPRCGSPVKLAHGAKINLPHRLDCYNCHFHPILEFRPPA